MLINRAIKLHSVALYLVCVLLLGLLIPITAGMVITLGQERIKLEDELSEFHRETLKTLVVSTEDAMLSFSPEGVRNIAGVLLKDERIVSIEVFSELFDLYLLRVSKQIPDHQFDSFSMRETVVKDDEVLGYVQVEVDNGWIIPRIEEARNRIIILFSSMFLSALLLVVPAIYYKILKPLRRLTRQADLLSKGELGIECDWRGKDELSLLGKTLDSMRSKLNDNFNVMKEMAVTDELTGLPNRHGFSAEIKKIMHLSKRYKHPLSIAIFDLDYFKAINDTYGHGVGDEVLKEFSRLVCSRIRNTDIFARIGGEEFVMVMPETSIEAAKLLLNKIREVISGQHFAHGEKVTTSIGVTSYSGVEQLDQLLEAADNALYQAKRKGRDQVVVYLR
ncbi:diguanylate cyclase [Maridesulfovibrio ferrireducens]|uniref:GGDEF domain-containing protein n=1 Tax=Maridesulfovibrio ferrireducens TaxID=246191 RepID=UPI001A1AEFCE|nr:diguanylate cyclase [Maridesulfovibrio ferrireducens]MBI9112469.1 diguanylate cyclase [Maridesulfovibrio ferrireducens]